MLGVADSTTAVSVHEVVACTTTVCKVVAGGWMVKMAGLNAKARVPLPLTHTEKESVSEASAPPRGNTVWLFAVSCLYVRTHSHH